MVEREDGTYVMTYTQWNQKTYTIGVATSPDLLHWTKHGPALGETGPYAQYAVVRATSIFRKAAIDPDTFCTQVAGKILRADLVEFLNGENANEIWDLWLASAKTSYIVNQCIATTEPAHLAKHAFQLAQLFNTFYHRHPILSETDEKRKQLLLVTVAVVRRELIRTLAVMGITAPPVM